MDFKSMRESKNMTQDELAKKLKISRSTVSMWEINESFPKTDLLIPLSEIFECSVNDILLMKNTKASTA